MDADIADSSVSVVVFVVAAVVFDNTNNDVHNFEVVDIVYIFSVLENWELDSVIENDVDFNYFVLDELDIGLASNSVLVQVSSLIAGTDFECYQHIFVFDELV